MNPFIFLFLLPGLAGMLGLWCVLDVLRCSRSSEDNVDARDSVRDGSQAVAESVVNPALVPVWHPFDDGEMWWAGEVVWLWEASWEKPRLAIADPEDPGEWSYIRGKKVGEDGEAWPTHCSYPVAPAFPMAHNDQR